MEVQVKELIEKIWNDGVKDAETKAAVIIKDAGAKAEAIIIAAKKEAAEMTARAREDAQKAEQAGREALKQAGRDLILNLQSRITDLFTVIVRAEVAQAMDAKVIGESIVKLIGSWQGNVSDIQVVLTEKDFAVLEDNLRGQLAAQVNKGLEIKPSAGLDSGFLVAVKDGSAYHNFSAEGIAAVLSESLNPRISALLAEGVKSKAEA
jgi:V/A-type H+-transporting ATPase subunit E